MSGSRMFVVVLGALLIGCVVGWFAALQVQPPSLLTINDSLLADFGEGFVSYAGTHLDDFDNDNPYYLHRVDLNGVGSYYGEAYVVQDRLGTRLVTAYDVAMVGSLFEMDRPVEPTRVKGPRSDHGDRGGSSRLVTTP